MKNDKEQKAILIDLMNNEPLMSAEEFIENLAYYVDPNLLIEYANYHTQWHLNNVKKDIEKEVYFDYYTDEFGDMASTEIVNKQSITNAFDNYITNNLK